MTKLSDDAQATIDLYYKLTLLELYEGCPKFIIEDTLEIYEFSEDYLACAGVKKALDEYSVSEFTKVMVKMEEIKGKYNLE